MKASYLFVATILALSQGCSSQDENHADAGTYVDAGLDSAMADAGHADAGQVEFDAAEEPRASFSTIVLSESPVRSWSVVPGGVVGYTENEIVVFDRESQNIETTTRMVGTGRTLWADDVSGTFVQRVNSDAGIQILKWESTSEPFSMIASGVSTINGSRYVRAGTRHHTQFFYFQAVGTNDVVLVDLENETTDTFDAGGSIEKLTYHSGLGIAVIEVAGPNDSRIAKALDPRDKTLTEIGPIEGNVHFTGDEPIVLYQQEGTPVPTHIWDYETKASRRLPVSQNVERGGFSEGDDRYLMLGEPVAEAARVFVVDLHEERVVIDEPNAHLYSFSVSPNAEWAAFVAGPEGAQQFVTFDLSTGDRVERVAAEHQWGSAAIVSEAGRAVAQEIAADTFHVWHPASGGTTFDNVKRAVPSENGETWVLHDWTGRVIFYHAESGLSFEVSGTHAGGDRCSPVIAPDGSRAFFRQRDDGRIVMWSKTGGSAEVIEIGGETDFQTGPLGCNDAAGISDDLTHGAIPWNYRFEGGMRGWDGDDIFDIERAPNSHPRYFVADGDEIVYEVIGPDRTYSSLKTFSFSKRRARELGEFVRSAPVGSNDVVAWRANEPGCEDFDCSQLVYAYSPDVSEEAVALGPTYKEFLAASRDYVGFVGFDDRFYLSFKEDPVEIEQ